MNNRAEILLQIAQCLNESEDRKAMLLARKLPLDSNAILESLAELALEPALVDKLIEFLSSKKLKLVREKNKGLLYYNLFANYTDLKNTEGQFYFLSKAVKHPHLLSNEKHIANYHLGLLYCSVAQLEKAEEYLKAAYHLEKKEKKILIDGNQSVLTMLLDSVKATQADSRFNTLRMLISLEPKDPRIEKAVGIYLDTTLSCTGSAKILPVLEFCYFIKIYPALKAKLPAARDILLKLPEKECSLSEKAEHLCQWQQYDHAIELAQLAHQKNEMDSQSLICLIKCMVVVNRKIEALQYCEKALLCPSLTPEVRNTILLQHATLNTQLGNLVASHEFAKTSAASHPNDYQSKLNKAVNALHAGHRRKAKAKFHAMIKDFPERVEHTNAFFKTLLSDKKEGFDSDADPLVLSEQLQVYLSKGCYAAAEKIGLFLIAKDPSNIFTTLRLASVYEKQGRYDESLKLYFLLNEKEPNRYSFQIARAYFNLHCYPEAEERLWPFLRDPQSHLKENHLERHCTFYLLFDIYKITRNFDRGVTEYRNALNDLSLSLSDMEKQAIYYSLAVLYDLGGQKQEREQAIEQALAFPSHENIHPEFNRFLGLVYYQNNKDDEAIGFLQKALLYNPKDTQMLLILGAALYKVVPPQKKKALHYLSIALSRDPSLLPFILDFPLSENDSKILEEGSFIEEVEEKEATASAFSINDDLTPSLPAPPLSLTPEQEAHRVFQDLKKRLKECYLEEKASAEKGWHLPKGFLSANDPHVFKLAIAQHLKADSCVYAFLDLETLQRECPHVLIFRWQGLLKEGKIVGKGKQGIRFLSDQEATANDNYKAKLILYGLFGNARAWGKVIQGADGTKLLHIDKAILKH